MVDFHDLFRPTAFLLMSPCAGSIPLDNVPMTPFPFTSDRGRGKGGDGQEISETIDFARLLTSISGQKLKIFTSPNMVTGIASLGGHPRAPVSMWPHVVRTIGASQNKALAVKRLTCRRNRLPTGTPGMARPRAYV